MNCKKLEVRRLRLRRAAGRPPLAAKPRRWFSIWDEPDDVLGAAGPGIRLRVKRLAPVPVRRRQQDQHLARSMGRDVRDAETALALGRATLTERQETAEAAPGGAIGRIAEKPRAAVQVEAGAGQEAQAHLLGRCVRAHHAGDGVAVGEAERGDAECLGVGDELVRMRAAFEERKVGDGLQLGIGRQARQTPGGCHARGHAKSPCTNQRGKAGAAAPSDAVASPSSSCSALS